MEYPASPGVSEIAELQDYCRRGNITAISELATRELIREPGTLGYTALHWASQCGHDQAVKLLIELGADVNAVCDMGESALHLAADRDFVECAKLLVAAGIDVDISNKNGIDAFQLAKSEGMRNVIKKINLDDTSSFIVNYHESDSE